MEAEEVGKRRGKARMRVGKPGLRGRGRVPKLERTANAPGLARRRDKILLGEAEELLAGGLTGDTESFAKRRGRQRTVHLERHQDAIGRCLHLRSEEHTSELQSLMRISYAV